MGYAQKPETPLLKKYAPFFKTIPESEGLDRKEMLTLGDGNYWKITRGCEKFAPGNDFSLSGEEIRKITDELHAIDITHTDSGGGGTFPSLDVKT